MSEEEQEIEKGIFIDHLGWLGSLSLYCGSVIAPLHIFVRLHKLIHCLAFEFIRPFRLQRSNNYLGEVPIVSKHTLKTPCLYRLVPHVPIVPNRPYWALHRPKSVIIHQLTCDMGSSSGRRYYSWPTVDDEDST